MSFSEKVIMNGTTWASILSSVRNQTGKSAALVAGQVPAQIDSIQKTVEYLYIDGTQATLDENDIVIFTNSGGGSGITPTGTLSISTNGTYNVTNYASANVSVPTGTARTSADLTASGATVTVPAGLYSEQVTKSVASGTEGTPVATKGIVSNHAVSVTPSVTNTGGYIAGGTKTGTAVSVSASELVSGSETKTVNGTYDVTNLAELVVNVPQSGSAATLITKNITSNGTYDAEDDNADGYSSVTVAVPHIGPHLVLIGQSTHTLAAYTNTSTAEQIDTGINIKNTDYALGLVVITCDGTKTNAADWGGITIALFGRYNSNSAVMSGGCMWLKNNTLSRAQMTTNASSSTSYGVNIFNNTNNIVFGRKAHGTACPEVMAGTYTVKVYGFTTLG